MYMILSKHVYLFVQNIHSYHSIDQYQIIHRRYCQVRLGTWAGYCKILEKCVHKDGYNQQQLHNNI